MRNIWNILAIALLSTTSLFSEIYRPLYVTEVAAGYRHDNYKWTMLGTGLDRHRKWTMNLSDLDIAQVSARGYYASCYNYTLRLSGSYGGIYHGHARTSGFRHLRDSPPILIGPVDREHPIRERDGIEYTRITLDADKGEVYDCSAALGYQFTADYYRCVITPLVGWSMHYQRFKMNHGDQVIDHDPILGDVGPLSQLNVDYNPRWFGPWVGVDFITELEVPCVYLFGSLEWHWAQLRSKGRWNYQGQFINKFKHTGHGHGMEANLGMSYNVGCGWYVGVVTNYMNYQGDHRTKHRTLSLENHLPDPDQVLGTMPTVPRTRHAKVRPEKWNSWSVSLAVDYLFGGP